MIKKHIFLVVLPDPAKAVAVRNPDVRHGTLQILVNGGLECVAVGDLHVYKNADSANSQPNLRATQLLQKTGLDLPNLAGTIVILGRTTNNHDSDCLAHLIQLAKRLFDIPSGIHELLQPLDVTPNKSDIDGQGSRNSERFCPRTITNKA